MEVDGVRYAVSAAAPDGLRTARRLRYFGHFPVADIQAELPGDLHVAVRAWSPFIPGDAAASNTPAAGFDVWLRNEGIATRRGWLQFASPGGPEAQPAAAAWSRGDALGATAAAWRDGREFGYVVAALGNPAAVVVEADVPTIGVPFDLPPGGTARLRFVLAWCYPHFTTSDSHPRTHRYARSFADAGEAAAYLAAHWDGLLRRILKWQSAVYASAEPPWLQDWLINSLYALPKNTFWLDDERTDGWYGPTGLYTHSESHTGCPITETIVCRFHGHFPALFFFPELERTTLAAFRHYQLGSGEIPFAFGSGTGVDTPIYHRQHPINSTEYVLMVQRYFARTADLEFAREFLPSVRSALAYADLLDTDRDGLVNDHPHNLPGGFFPANQFYDCWPWHGTSAYVAGIGLAALAAGVALGEACGDTAFAAACHARLARGLEAYQEKLWSGTYYRLYTDPEAGDISDAVLCNQLVAEWCARLAGLGTLLPPDHVASAIATIERLNVAATGAGAINSMLPSGERDASGGGDHAANIFVGEVAAAACTWMYAGRRDAGEAVGERLYQSLTRHRSIWDAHCLLRAEDGSPMWGREYYSNAIAWAIPMARAGQDVAACVRLDGLVGRVLAAAR